MDERAVDRRTRHGDLAVGAPASKRSPQARSTIDGAVGDEAVDIADVLRSVAARLDAVLAPSDPTAAPPARLGQHDAAGWDRNTDATGAVEAWSAVMARRGVEATPEMRRAALATTVLRLSPDGAGGVVHAESVPAPTDANPSSIGSHVDVRGQRIKGGDDAIDERLRRATERLEQRRAVAVANDAEYVPIWRRPETRRSLRQLAAGIAIVAASAIASFLLV